MSNPTGDALKALGEFDAGVAQKIENDPGMLGAFNEQTYILRMGNQLMSMRNTRGISRDEIASSLGIERSLVDELEKGTSLQGPTLQLINRWAAICGFTANFAFSPK